MQTTPRGRPVTVTTSNVETSVGDIGEITVDSADKKTRYNSLQGFRLICPVIVCDPSLKVLKFLPRSHSSRQPRRRPERPSARFLLGYLLQQAPFDHSQRRRRGDGLALCGEKQRARPSAAGPPTNSLAVPAFWSGHSVGSGVNQAPPRSSFEFKSFVLLVRPVRFELTAFCSGEPSSVPC